MALNVDPVKISGYIPVTGRREISHAAEIPSLPGDSFVAGNVSTGVPCKGVLTFQGILETAAIADDEKNAPRQGNVFRITPEGVQPLLPQKDGSYLVEEETGTTAFIGQAAKDYLKNTTFFDQETEVIIPSNGSVDVEYNREGLSFAETGAVLIGAGTQARVKIQEGAPLVTRNGRAPGWYQKLEPSGDMGGEFEKIAGINRKLFDCLVGKKRFSPENLRKLQDFGLVKQEPGDDSVVRWDSAIRNEDELRSRLIEAGFQGQSIDDNAKIWYDTIKRKLYGLESGRLPKSSFEPEVYGKLVKGQVLKENFLDKTNAYWAAYATEKELKNSLAGMGIEGGQADGVMESWRKTTKSGYDNTGLTWDRGKVVAYLLREKQNIWNEHPTEWIVNSTEYAGENKPFTVGVSSVKSRGEMAEPAPFKDIRPAEVIHRHPVNADKKQTEVYTVNSGKAVLLSMQNDKPCLSFLEPGDMAVISPGVAHCVLAVQGDYEHMCFQVPSAFQYGFLFKEELSYDRFGADEKELLSAALDGLKEGRRGTFPADGLKS
jgi:hypothetical protein